MFELNVWYDEDDICRNVVLVQRRAARVFIHYSHKRATYPAHPVAHSARIKRAMCPKEKHTNSLCILVSHGLSKIKRINEHYGAKRFMLVSHAAPIIALARALAQENIDLAPGVCSITTFAQGNLVHLCHTDHLPEGSTHEWGPEWFKPSNPFTKIPRH
jgi:hypothetical protein